MYLGDLSNFHHPIWAIVRLAVVLSFLTLVLWLNASSFDETELKVIGWMFMGFLGQEFMSPLIKKVVRNVTGEHK